MKNITPTELIKQITHKKNIQIIDVREKYEFDDGSISNINIPLDEVIKSIDKIENDKNVIIYCQTGRRACAIINILEIEYNFKNLYCLLGGYKAYINEKNK